MEWSAPTGRLHLRMAPVTDKATTWSYPYRCLQGRQDPRKGKEGPGDPRGLLLLLILFFSVNCNPCFPLAYKRESMASHEGDSNRNTLHRFRLKPIEPLTDQNTQAHNKEAIELSQYLFTSFTRDLGPVTLSIICNPYYELFSASNTSSSNKLYVGTFYPNQYKPHVLLAHHPSQTCNIRNLLVGDNSKHR